ncbi:hypothetical protein D3C87_175280 [compost metagenome]
MKKVVFAIFALFVAACDGGGGGGNSNNNYGGQIATTPLDNRCFNGQMNCNSGVYNQFYQYGWMAYPGFQYGYNYTNYFNQYGVCNCPVGTLPTYNSYAGLGCVRQEYLNPFMGFSFYWQVGWGGYGSYGYSHPMNDYPVNINQISNVSGYPNNGNCQQNLIQSCYANQANSCGTGATCRITAAGSGLGICVRN